MPRDINQPMTRSERQRVRILALIAQEPMSAAEIGEAIFMSTAGILKYMRALRNEVPRRAYISSYVINGCGRPTPMYSAGSQPDVPYEHMTLVQSHHQHLLSRLVMQLEIAPRTTRELSKMMGLSMSGIHNLVRELRTMGWCYIGDWSPVVNRKSAPMHALGVGKDKKQPRKSRADIWKAQKKDTDVHEHLLAKRRARVSMKKAVAKPSGIFAALGL